MSKQILNEEFLHMQKLAGIITEGEYKQKLNELGLITAIGTAWLLSGAIQKFKKMKKNADAVWKKMDKEEQISKDIQAAENAKDKLNTTLKGQLDQIQKDPDIAELLEKYNKSYDDNYDAWYRRTDGRDDPTTGENSTNIVGNTRILKQIEDKIQEKYGEDMINTIRTAGGELTKVLKNN